jgi:hypothetical protein
MLRALTTELDLAEILHSPESLSLRSSARDLKSKERHTGALET